MANNNRNAQKPETVGQKVRKLQAEIPLAFKTGDASEVEKIRKTITGMAKAISECRAIFDTLIDKRDDGLFGENFAPDVKRIRNKSDKVGRPAKEKVDELADLDF